MKCMHVQYKHKYSKALKQFDVKTFDHVELAKYTNKKPRGKILFVLDYMPTDALETRKLFGSHTGTLFDNIFKVAENFYSSTNILNDYSWLAVTYNSIKTLGGSETFVELANAEFKKRLGHIIAEYKPDTVVTFGRDPYAALNEAYVSKYTNKDGVAWQQFYGTSIKTEFGGHKFNHVPSISLRKLLMDEAGASLIGYVARNMLTVLNDGVMPYGIPKLDYKIEMVDTIEKFDKLYNKLMKARIVAVDSEARNLNKKRNYTVTWQFAFDRSKAYILPYLHKDTPFLPNELKYIKKKLRNYFENNRNEWQVYANGGFDMCMARRDFGVRFFRANVWDVQGAEHCFHPDTLVVTEQGKIRIEDFIAMEARPRVLSYNHNLCTAEYKEVIFASVHDTTEDMYEIEYDGGTLRVTGNHKIWSVTRSAYIRADEICEDEEILALGEPER